MKINMEAVEQIKTRVVGVDDYRDGLFYDDGLS